MLFGCSQFQCCYTRPSMRMKEFVLQLKNFKAEISLLAEQRVLWRVLWQLSNDFIPPIRECVDTCSQWCPCASVVVKTVQRLDDGLELFRMAPSYVGACHCILRFYRRPMGTTV